MKKILLIALAFATSEACARNFDIGKFLGIKEFISLSPRGGAEIEPKLYVTSSDEASNYKGLIFVGTTTKQTHEFSQMYERMQKNEELEKKVFTLSNDQILLTHSDSDISIYSKNFGYVIMLMDDKASSKTLFDDISLAMKTKFENNVDHSEYEKESIVSAYASNITEHAYVRIIDYQSDHPVSDRSKNFIELDNWKDYICSTNRKEKKILKMQNKEQCSKLSTSTRDKTALVLHAHGKIEQLEEITERVRKQFGFHYVHAQNNYLF